MTIGGRDYIFTHPSMVDGQGYQWNTGSRETTPSYQMPKPDGGMYDSSEKGPTGHGYARITILGD